MFDRKYIGPKRFYFEKCLLVLGSEKKTRAHVQYGGFTVCSSNNKHQNIPVSIFYKICAFLM
jgi:hypothetical protein